MMDGTEPFPARRGMPQRRMNESTVLEVGRFTLTATVGFNERGLPLEIFLNSAKPGTDIDHQLGDAAVVISIALQHGVKPSELAKTIGRIPQTWNGPAIQPASPIGAALDLLVRYEQGEL